MLKQIKMWSVVVGVSLLCVVGTTFGQAKGTTPETPLEFLQVIRRAIAGGNWQVVVDTQEEYVFQSHWSKRKAFKDAPREIVAEMEFHAGFAQYRLGRKSEAYNLFADLEWYWADSKTGEKKLVHEDTWSEPLASKDMWIICQGLHRAACIKNESGVEAVKLKDPGAIYDFESAIEHLTDAIRCAPDSKVSPHAKGYRSYYLDRARVRTNLYNLNRDKSLLRLIEEDIATYKTLPPPSLPPPPTVTNAP